METSRAATSFKSVSSSTLRRSLITSTYLDDAVVIDVDVDGVDADVVDVAGCVDDVEVDVSETTLEASSTIRSSALVVVFCLSRSLCIFAMLTYFGFVVVSGGLVVVVSSSKSSFRLFSRKLSSALWPPAGSSSGL